MKKILTQKDIDINESAKFWTSIHWYERAFHWIFNFNFAAHCSACAAVVKKHGEKLGNIVSAYFELEALKIACEQMIERIDRLQLSISGECREAAPTDCSGFRKPSAVSGSPVGAAN